MSRRPAGADNFLKWRRSIVEHLELRRINWHEFAMFAWLCTKASPQTGTLRTSWPTLARETGLSANHVEQVCRALKRKRYVWYLPHRGAGRRLVEVAIDKYPTADGGYTDLSARFRPGAARTPRPGATDSPAELPTDALMDVPTDWPTDRPTDVLTEHLTDVLTDLRAKELEESHGSPLGRPRSRREREREKDRDRECARAPDGRIGQDRTDEGARTDGRDHSERHDRKDGRGHVVEPDRARAWREDMAAPVAIRELLAAQPWWRPPAPPAEDRTSARGADAGGTPDRGRATAASHAAPGGTPDSRATADRGAASGGASR